MWTRGTAILVLIVLAACTAQPPTTGRSLSPTASAAPSSSPPATPTATATSAPTSIPVVSPSATSVTVTARCQHPPGSDPLVLGLNYVVTRLTVLDVSDPLHPVALCDVGPAGGGRFLSDGRLAFWTRDSHLGVADLARGTAVITGRTAHVIDGGTFNPEGSSFAYRSTDTGGTTTTYLASQGVERTLFSRVPLGGHGGPIGGPTSELTFSADGAHLLVYDLFIAAGDAIPPLQVFDLEGTAELQGRFAMANWSQGQATLFYLQPTQAGNFASGEVFSWTKAGGSKSVAGGLASYNWPVQAADGSIYYTAYDGSGYPHLWVLGRGGPAQVSTAQSSHPFLVGQYAWTDEEQPCQCGPGGTSAPDGQVVAHNLTNGTEAVISVPPLGPLRDTTFGLLDYWAGPRT